MTLNTRHNREHKKEAVTAITRIDSGFIPSVLWQSDTKNPRRPTDEYQLSWIRFESSEGVVLLLSRSRPKPLSERAAELQRADTHIFVLTYEIFRVRGSEDFRFILTPRRSIALTLGIAAALPGNPAKPRNMNERQVLCGGSVSP
jgi:hypothetical protein